MNNESDSINESVFGKATASLLILGQEGIKGFYFMGLRQGKL
jgi:hypothetical protein